MQSTIRLGIVFISLLFAQAANAAERTVVVVLFDGFAPAMMDATSTPNFDRMAREGVHSRHLVPAFPTISLINHTTFETGCWPARHGVLSNEFYDPKWGRFGEKRDVADGDWHMACESMWEAAERQGVKAAVFNWVGRWSSTRGPRAATINSGVPWAHHESNETVLARGLKMLADNGPNHPRLIAVYFNIPDDIAHFHGTTAPETEAAVREADSFVGKLMAGIRALPPGREGTLVIGTDHGMMDVGSPVNVTRLMHEYSVNGRQATDGATSFIYLDKFEDENDDASVLRYAGKGIFDVYLKGHFPSYAHLGSSGRVPDILLVAHPPYWMVGGEVMPQWADMLGINWFWPAVLPFNGGLKATHGYDPSIVQMHGIFYAWGAGVAHGVTVPRLDMIDIHPTVMKLLGLQPSRPVDGHPVEALFAAQP